MKIVTIVKPFNSSFPVYVYNEGELVEEKDANMDNLIDEIILLADKYSISQIDVAGPKKFNQGIQKLIEEKGLTKYDVSYQVNLI